MNGHRDFLGESAEILIRPDDGTAAGIVGGERVIVRSANGELTRHCGGRPLDPARSGVDPHGHQQANVNRLTNTDDIDVVTAWCAIPAYPSPCTRVNQSA